MSTVKKLLLSTLLGSIIFFAWSSASWMALPWHKATIHKFSDENAISTTILANIKKSGVYYLSPYDKEGKLDESKKSFPTAFVAVNKSPAPKMTTSLFQYYLMILIGAFFLSALLLTARMACFWQSLTVVILFAIGSGVVTYGPEMIWWRFSTNFLMVNFADLLIGWFLAGLVMVPICKMPKSETKA